MKHRVTHTNDHPCDAAGAINCRCTMDPSLMLRIRERAYHIWIDTGGHADQNWLQAEKEILQTPRSQPTAGPTAKKRSPVSKQKMRKQVPTPS